jgi:hypothetical protein
MSVIYLLMSVIQGLAIGVDYGVQKHLREQSERDRWNNDLDQAFHENDE